MNFKKYFYTFLLFFVFGVALLLRFYDLESVPAGFHLDEANLGYNAYSILTTGKDDSGNPFPLYINTFNDFNPAGYDYLDIPAIAVFGLTVFAVRFPAALFGALIVFPVYFVGSMVFKKRVGLLAALFCAISPWGVIFSRGSAETIVAVFFASVGIALLIRGIKYSEKLPVAAAVIPFVASVLVYPAPRVFIPIFFLICLLFPIPIWKVTNTSFKRTVIAAFIVTALIIGILVFKVGGGTARFNQVSIFSSPSTQLVKEEQTREDGAMNAGVLSTKLFHNTPVEYAWTFTNNYFKYFSGNFLFTEGGRPLWFVIPQIGLILLCEFPFILYGIYLASKSNKPLPKLLFFWLIIPPAVSALTLDDSPNMRRALLMFIPIEIFAACGVVEVLDILKKKARVVAVVVIAALFTFNTLFFLHQYFIHQPIHQNWHRNIGFGTLMGKINAMYDEVDVFVFTKSSGGIYPLVLFYSKYDPRAYQAEGSTKDRENTGFGKYFFVTEMCPSINGDDRVPLGKTVFIEQGTCRAPKQTKQEYILDNDNSPVFHLVFRDTTPVKK